MSALSNGQLIEGFTVVGLIKKGAYAESYHVTDAQGRSCFFKLISLAKLRPYQMDEHGRDIEVEVCRGLDNECLCSYVKDGEVVLGGQKYVYLVNTYENADTLADLLQQHGPLPLESAKAAVIEVLGALSYLHSRPVPIIHNEVTAQNVMLNEAGEVKLIDFGNSRFLSQGVARQLTDEENVFYVAPERLNGVFSVQSDIYSVGVLLYHLVFNQLPFYFDMSLFSSSFRWAALQSAREQTLKMPAIPVEGFTVADMDIIRKALAADPEQRFQSADEFIAALEADDADGGCSADADAQKQDKDSDNDKEEGATGVVAEVAEADAPGNGFSDIAGMQDVKDLLGKKIVNLLRNPEKARKYKLQIPNGALLYGPQGCGKKIWAQRMAEEIEYRYIYLRVTDLLRFYMLGQHGVLSQLMEQAEKMAPVVFCFDELELLLPNSEQQFEYVAEAGTEFLDLITNSSKKNVFVVAITSRPDLVDGSAVQPGRLEQKVYIPMPDEEWRKDMFAQQLMDRPIEGEIDYARLSKLASNYVVSDIAFVVNDAALRASETDDGISQKLLEDTIAQKKPSVGTDLLKQYEKMRDILEEKNLPDNDRKVGFR